MKKIALGLSLAAIMTTSSFAMEVMGTGTMMKKDDMKASGTMMMDHKMDDKMMKAEDKMMKKDMMMKCLDVKKATRMEIKKFQKENGIITTGFIGKLTKAKLAKMDCMKEMKGEIMMKKDDAIMMKDKMMDGKMMDKMDDKMMKATGTTTN